MSVDAGTALGVIGCGLTVGLVGAAFVEGRHWRVDEQRHAAIGRQARRRGGRLHAYVKKHVEGAGVPLTADEFMSVWLACIGLPAMVALILQAPALLVCLLAIAGAMGPWVWLAQVKGRARQRFADDLGMVLPLVASNLRGGLSLRQALVPVARNLREPVRGEFEILSHELDQGVPIERALANMAERTDNKDLVLLASGVATQAETGGNLADIIDTIAEAVRVRTELRKTIRSKTSQQRATSTFLALFPIVMLVIFCVMSDVFRAFYLSPVGWVVIACCAVLEVIGYTIMRKMADISID